MGKKKKKKMKCNNKVNINVDISVTNTNIATSETIYTSHAAIDDEVEVVDGYRLDDNYHVFNLKRF